MKLLTVTEVAQRLSLGRSTVYRMLGEQIPAYKLPNGQVRVDQDDLDHFITNCRVERKPDPMPRPRMRQGPRNPRGAPVPDEKLEPEDFASGEEADRGLSLAEVFARGETESCPECGEYLAMKHGPQCSRGEEADRG